MIERRKGLADRRLPATAQVSEIERALESILFLRPQILAFVRDHGPGAAAHFESVISLWYRGSLEQRVAFMQTCAGDPTLTRAWDIVHAAGALAAPLIPYVVRRYYGQGSVDARA